MENENNNADFIKGFALALIPIHLFFYYYNLLREVLKISYLDYLYTSLSPRLSMMTNSFAINLLVIILLLIHSITIPKQKDKTLDQKEIVKGTVLGLFIVIGSSAVFFILPFNKYGFFIYSTGIVTGYFFYMKNIALFVRFMQTNQNEIFNDSKESFPQMIEKVETEHSINIPYYFYFQKQWQKGWLNFVNPFRAILVAGSPGSGKSFGTIILAIHQLIHKNYCLYVYDFKIPTLALEVINGLWHYKELLKKQHGSIAAWEKSSGLKLPVYKQIDFDKPIKSHRINPIASYLIEKPLDAIESSKFVMQGLSGGKAGNDNDFFKQSAESLLAACIYYLARRSKQYGQEFSTLPHVIELLTKPYEIMFPMLMSDPYIIKMASTFNNAFEKGVFEQLQGQVDSLRVPLTQLQDPKIYWIFTGNDFSINISDPQNPIILVIGNNPEAEKTYGILLSLLNGKLTKTINKKGQRSLGIIIDELPTLPFESLHSLIATARSNKVACMLGIQDIAQFELNYGKEKANMIIGMVGSILTGQIRGDLAKSISECIGLINQTQTTDTISKDGLTINEQISLHAAVPVSTISNLAQGEMVGTISDDFTAPLKYKRFHGKVDAMSSEASPTTIKPITEIPDLAFPLLENENHEERNNRVRITLRENFNSVTRDINMLQYMEMTRFQVVKKQELMNLETIAKSMVKYIMDVNNYEDKNRDSGMTIQGEQFDKNLIEIKKFFIDEIVPFVGINEAEIEDKLIDGKIVAPEKRLYLDFKSEECQILQSKYRRLYEMVLKVPDDSQFAEEEDFMEIQNINNSTLQELQINDDEIYEDNFESRPEW